MMCKIQKTTYVIGSVLSAFICVVIANDINSFKTNKVEFKTQAPPEPFPEAPTDCYEYLYGKLSAIRRHGTTWQNGVADCSNCTCDNGDIRCFFHFCNGPSTGYMTPPTTDAEDPSFPSTRLEEEEDRTEEESSGYPPHDLAADEEDDDEDHDDFEEGEDREDEEGGGGGERGTGVEEDLGAEWPPKVLPEKWQNELSAYETSSAPSASLPKGLKGEGGGFEMVKEEQTKDRTENETHDVFTNYFCGKSCKKICDRGFKVDPLTGCWKCHCNTCPTRVTCKNKCVFGYASDSNGCDTCNCVTPSQSNNEDIVFSDEATDHHHHHVTSQQQSDTQNDTTHSQSDTTTNSVNENTSSSTSSSEQYDESYEEKEEEGGGEEEEEEDEDWVFKSSSYFSPDEGTRPPTPLVKEATLRDLPTDHLEVTSFPNDKDVGVGNHDDHEEPCNTTQVRGCLDGSQKFRVGGSWSRGPCVACRCVAPGYSECNITQCRALRNCPAPHRYTPEGACCDICKEDTPTPGFLEKSHDSRSTSRVPTDLLPLRSHEEGSLLQKEEFAVNKESPEEEAIIRSVPKDGQSHLLLILIPMGVLFSVGVLLFAHWWRRYHRDKYDINAYRPEEKQKLRPVKTLNDDSSSIGHVC